MNFYVKSWNQSVITIPHKFITRAEEGHSFYHKYLISQTKYVIILNRNDLSIRGRGKRKESNNESERDGDNDQEEDEEGAVRQRPVGDNYDGGDDHDGVDNFIRSSEDEELRKGEKILEMKADMM